MGKGFTISLRCGQARRLPIASMAYRAFVSAGAMGLQGDKIKDDKHTLHCRLSPSEATRNLQQLSIKLWQYNAKLILKDVMLALARRKK